MLSLDELEFFFELLYLYACTVAGFLVLAGQSNRAAMVSVFSGGIIGTLIRPKVATDGYTYSPLRSKEWSTDDHCQEHDQ